MPRAPSQPLQRPAYLSPQQSMAPVVPCALGLCSFPRLLMGWGGMLQKGLPSRPSCSWLCYSRQ